MKLETQRKDTQGRRGSASGDDNRWHSKVDLHVEHADGTQSSTGPLFLVVFEPRVHGIGEFADNRNGPSRTGQMCLFTSVDDLRFRVLITGY